MYLLWWRWMMCCCHLGLKGVHVNLSASIVKHWNHNMSQKICITGLTLSLGSSSVERLVWIFLSLWWNPKFRIWKVSKNVIILGHLELCNHCIHQPWFVLLLTFSLDKGEVARTFVQAVWVSCLDIWSCTLGRTTVVITNLSKVAMQRMVCFDGSWNCLSGPYQVFCFEQYVTSMYLCYSLQWKHWMCFTTWHTKVQWTLIVFLTHLWRLQYWPRLITLDRHQNFSSLSLIQNGSGFKNSP